MDTNSVLDWYNEISARRVDLIGDYAGNEVFFIEGDSLLLYCLSDNDLDFQEGFQLLHAVYIVEHFLQNMLQRKANFQIVFFEKHRALCIPAFVEQKNYSKYLLTREILRAHLESYLAQSSTVIRPLSFDSTADPNFLTYLNSSGAYFIMCHDGAHLNTSPMSNIEDEGAGKIRCNFMRQHKICHRNIIRAFLMQGFNVALINGLEWRDTKVMSEVLESSRKMHLGQQGVDALVEDMSLLDIASEILIEDVKPRNVLTSKMNGAQIGSRRHLSLFALVAFLKIDSSKERQSFASIYLLHLAFLENLPLSARRIDLHSGGMVDQEFEIMALEMIRLIYTLIRDDEIHARISTIKDLDLADLIDGRLLFACARLYGNPASKIQAEIKEGFDSTAQQIQELTGLSIPLTDRCSIGSISELPQTAEKVDTLLPFNNAVFDKHLAPVRVVVKASRPAKAESGRIFREVTHWHNAKRKIITKAAPVLSGRDKMKIARRNDNFMAEMQTYAASLTNANGKSLDPQTITLGGTTKAKEISKENTVSNSSNAGKSVSKGGAQNIIVKGKGAKKQAMMQELAAVKASRDSDNADKILTSWRLVRKNLDAERSLVSRYHKMIAYRRDLPDGKRRIVSAEVQLHLLVILFNIFCAVCTSHHAIQPDELSTEALGIRALLWDSLRKLPSQGGYTKTIAIQGIQIAKAANLKDIDLPIPIEDKALAYDPGFAPPKELPAAPRMSAQEFEMLHCGPYMDRNLDSQADSRVSFEPDGWQRKVLDELDQNNSLVVVAPTSAGKTFISFYAMEKILRSNDDSVLVYVAPTKALVNQIAAEVQARFSKSYKHGGKSVWAIHTRDYRINNPTGCQVLVTVPHILQIMLLSPAHSKAWTTRIKYIIFDEVHSIGQAEDGVVWEQLLLLAPCPIIALSATVGNPENFSSWLLDTQSEWGNKLKMVEHTHRYSDLRKFIYHPPKEFTFCGLVDRPAFGTLGLDGIPGLTYMHPIASLVNKSRGIPRDLALEARDCFLLWRAMVAHQTAEYPVPKSHGLSEALPRAIIKKKDVIEWEKSLKTLLQKWMIDEKSPFDLVLADLSKPLDSAHRETHFTSTRPKDDNASRDPIQIDESDPLQTTLPLLCKLQERNALPAIFFNYERNSCERICRVVTQQLTEAEDSWKECSAAWKAKLQGYEIYKKEMNKLANKKAPKQISKKKGAGDEDSKDDRLLDETTEDLNPYAAFDPDDPIDGFHFAARHKASKEELSKYFEKLRYRDIPEDLIAGLKRGIGVHHAGMNRKYRQIVEILFRKGFLRIVIATGTLALGINMPCATVVFNQDSVFLTALNFRQAAGRAGRRGFDLLGNVVFQGVSRDKACRLLSSRLPDLSGHFPVTTSLILRLFTLLHDSEHAPYAIKAINALLSQPRLYLDGPAFKHQVLHHLRFSIEYLRRQDLLSAAGAPINFAGLTSHLYFTENSSFALNALLKDGCFHDLCADILTNESEVLRTLMLVMAHLFGRRICRQADAEQSSLIKSSSSIVFLPPLPPKASSALRIHNQETLQIFSTYVQSFADQHIMASETKLPLSGLCIGRSDTLSAPFSAKPTKVRSAFAALSGPGDDFATVAELCKDVRNGIFLEEAVVPHLDLHPEENSAPLNAYLYDFFMHGDINTLERANKIRKADVWFFLNDFSLVLATIVASLANFLKLPESDLSLEDLAGEGDDHENAQDDKFADDATVVSQGSTLTANSASTNRTLVNGRNAAASTAPAAARSKKKKLESWDDEEDDSGDEIETTGESITASKGIEHGENSSGLSGVKDPAEDLSKEELERGFLNIYKSFVKLRIEFDAKFRKIFA